MMTNLGAGSSIGLAYCPEKKGPTMADRKLTRNQRRQIDKLAPHTFRMLNDDVAFFEQYPDRRYRVRRANDAEIAQAEVLEQRLLQPPQGWCWFAIVKKEPGGYLRMFVAAPPTVETGLDAPDYLAEWIWEEAPSDAIQIGDVVTVVTDPAMVTGRPTKITFEPKENAAAPSRHEFHTLNRRSTH
jgi:hypothetical protein